MHQPRLPSVALTAALMLGACSSVPSTGRVTDTTTAPLNDLNLVRAQLPDGVETAQHADAALDAIVAGPQRSAENRARDGWRHPAETLRFFGLRADAQVLELAPGGGWFTEILAPYLREHGKLYTAHYPRNDSSDYRRQRRASFEALLSSQPAVFGRVTSGTLPAAPFTGMDGLTFERPLDAVLTFRNVHNWLEDGHLDDRLKLFFTLLRPGGVLGIEEHRAAPGTPQAQQITSGYLTEALVIEHALAAGFELVGRSELNANPRDTKDYAEGVWGLPPVLRGAPEGSAERARRLAIGESDRMTLKFIKPLVTR